MSVSKFRVAVCVLFHGFIAGLPIASMVSLHHKKSHRRNFGQSQSQKNRIARIIKIASNPVNLGNEALLPT